MTADETATLRQNVRPATVQGSLTAAAPRARCHALQMTRSFPIKAAVQIPVNTRSLATTRTSTGAAVPDDACLCGLAGVWHTLSIPADTSAAGRTVASESTQAVHAAMREQVPEWLGRLFHAPTTLPAYSLMVSSIGVAPLSEHYGQQITIELVSFLWWRSDRRPE